jgi:hypothetical protein
MLRRTNRGITLLQSQTAMLQRVHCLPIGCSDELLAFASPEVIRLVNALEGCCHPKRERLLARLALDPSR